MVGVRRVPKKSLYRLDNISELNKVAFTWSILEGEPFFLPCNSRWHGIDFTKKGMHVVI